MGRNRAGWRTWDVSGCPRARGIVVATHSVVGIVTGAIGAGAGFCKPGTRWLQLMPLSALVFACILVGAATGRSFEEAALGATQVRAALITNVRNSSGIRKRSVKGKMAVFPRPVTDGASEVAIRGKISLRRARHGLAYADCHDRYRTTVTTVLSTRAPTRRPICFWVVRSVGRRAGVHRTVRHALDLRPICQGWHILTDVP